MPISQLHIRISVLGACMMLANCAHAASLNAEIRSSHNEPIPGAVVHLHATTRNEVAITVSNERGQFAFQNLSPGTYRLEIKRDGHLIHQEVCNVSSENESKLIIVKDKP
jgi:multisubunit Na+/H+ antiporter MnhE subunit